MKKFCSPLLTLSYNLSVWLTAFFLTWIVLAQFNFGYSVWYRVLHIDQLIQTTAPHHYYKPSFQWTNAAEHARLFKEINIAVNHNGNHLADIQYYNARDHIHESMLNRDEILHLQDVSHLIQKGQWLGIGAVLTYLLCLLIFYRLKWKIPSIKNTLVTFAGLLLVITAAVFLLGPTRVFYQFHMWIFPPGHRWFFFYEESLMSLMMDAPDLFGYIAATLVVLSSLLFIGLLRMNQRINKN